MRKVIKAVQVPRSNMMQIEGRLIIGSTVRNLQNAPVHIVRMDERPGFPDPILVSEHWYGDAYNYACHTAAMLYPCDYDYSTEDDSYIPCYDDLEHMNEVSYYEYKAHAAKVGLIIFTDDFGNEIIIEGDIPFGTTTSDDFPLEEEDLPF